MKITKSQLKQIIKEELKNVLNETAEKISIWHDGNWHDTVLSDEESEAIHDAWDQDYESYSDVVERVLSSMRNLDIEDVEL